MEDVGRGVRLIAAHPQRRITSPEVIVNDVMVDPRNHDHVLLATDRSGVLVSNNAGVSFEPSNTGFAHRQVAALTVDPDDQNTLYAGLVNDKQYGGVFVSHDQGGHWRQLSAGLDGRDVFDVRKLGTHMLAGTSNGVFEFAAAGGSTSERWRPLDHIVNENLILVRKATKTRKELTRKVVKAGVLKARVTDIQIHDNRWIVAGNQGIFTSSNMGRTWQGGPLLGRSGFDLVRTDTKWIAAAGRNFLLLSPDNGEHWQEAALPNIVTSVNDLTFGPEESIWLACREGLYRSKDQGATWDRLLKLPVVNLASVFYDAQNRRMLVTALNSTEVFASTDDGQSWQHQDSGWLLRTLATDAGRLVASTAFDGVVIEKGAPQSAQAVAGGSETRSSLR